MPAVRDLVLYEGDDFTHVITFVGEDEVAYPMPGTYRAQIRRTVNSPAILASFSVDTTDAGAGVLTVEMEGSATEGIPPKGVWDLERTLDGIVTTLLYGKVTIIQGVTRDEGEA